MKSCIWLVTALLSGTKLVDVISTLKRINHPESETNPFARRIMKCVGMKPAILLFFLIAIGIILSAGLLALRGGLFAQITFISTGIFISIVQGAVAHANWFGIDNGITSLVRKTHNLRG